MRLAYGYLVLCHSFRVLVSRLHQPHRVSWETQDFGTEWVIALILLDPSLPPDLHGGTSPTSSSKRPLHCLLSLAVSFSILVFFQLLASSATGLLHMPPVPSDRTVLQPLAC